jgi:hypothetical protein
MMADIENLPRSLFNSPPNTPPFPPILTTPAITDPLEFHAYFVPYEPGVWAPYQPLTSDCYSPKLSSPQTTNQLFKSQQLPFNLLVLNERDKLAISVGFEQCSILLAQADIAQRQQFAIHRIHELEMERQGMELQEQIRQMERTLDMAVIEALQRVLIYFPPDAPDPITQTHDITLDMPSKIDFNPKYWLSLISFRVDDWVNRTLAMVS